MENQERFDWHRTISWDAFSWVGTIVWDFFRCSTLAVISFFCPIRAHLHFGAPGSFLIWSWRRQHSSFLHYQSFSYRLYVSKHCIILYGIKNKHSLQKSVCLWLALIYLLKLSLEPIPLYFPILLIFPMSIGFGPSLFKGSLNELNIPEP